MTNPIQIQRILFATDFLESSRLALDYAVAFAAHFDATLVMLHVAELSQAALEAEAMTDQQSLSRRLIQQRLEALAKGIRRLGLNVETAIEDGIPSDKIVQTIREASIDLLVLGIHGVHRGIEHLLIGSNTEKILLSADCPVLTVGAHVLSGLDLHLNFEEIMYLSDFTAEATAAAPYAVFFSREFNAPIDVCQLLPEVAETNQNLQIELAKAYCDSMKDILQDESSEWCTPAFHLQRGMEMDQMIERAQSHHAGLIVLGVRMESHLGRHLHTSFAYHLLARASCPVLTIRSIGADSAKAAS